MVKNLQQPWNLSIPQKVLIIEKSSLDYYNALHTKKNMVLLGTVPGKVLWGIKNGSSVASLQKTQFGTFIFKSVGC